MVCQATNSNAQLKAQKAPSGTMNVDFSEETIIFAKMKVLAQSGAFAFAQANTLATNILDLLQGVSRHN